MYIACPKCNTRLVINLEQIGPNGRKVKCSNCQHIWHQTKDNLVKFEAILSPQKAFIPSGNGMNLPALVPAKLEPYLYILPIITIGLIIFMVAVIFPSNFGENSLLNNRKIEIKDIKIENDESLKKITVNYKIHNIAEFEQKVPLVRIRLLDKNKRVIKARIDDHSKLSMLPDQFIEVKTEFIPIPPHLEIIDIMIGNKLDFILY